MILGILVIVTTILMILKITGVILLGWCAVIFPLALLPTGFIMLVVFFIILTIIDDGIIVCKKKLMRWMK